MTKNKGNNEVGLRRTVFHLQWVMLTKIPRPNFLSQVLKPTWTDLDPLVLGHESFLSREDARLWSLVLMSRHIPHRMRRKSLTGQDGYTVQVQVWFAKRAVDEIRLYLAENEPDCRSLVLADLRPVSGLEPTIFAMFLLVLFFLAYSRGYPGLGLYPSLWVKLGSADGGAIFSGEWWRLATALTLHSGGPHVAGNAVVGGVFIWLVSRRLGSGLAWFLTVLAGVFGTLLNSLVLGVHHNSIGFSTAVFGAAGLLAGIAPFGVAGGVHGLGRSNSIRKILSFVRAALIPFAAGLGLLAMLGAGEDTDLGAHLFGFISGLAIGLVCGFFATRFGLPSKKMDSWLYVAAIGVPLFAWFWAWLA